MKLGDKQDQFLITAYILGLVAVFFAINFNTTLGTIYGLFIFGFALYSIIDDKADFPIYKNNNWLVYAMIGIATYIVFIVSTSFGLNLIFKNAISTTSLMNSLLNASVPFLQNSQIVGILAYGIFIPFVETIAFLKFFEFFGDKILLIRGDYKFSNLRTWISMIITSGLFVLYHLTAKGLNGPVLALVFIMMMFSIVITIITKEQRSAIFMHNVANILSMIKIF